MDLAPNYPPVLDADGDPHEYTTGVTPIYRSDGEHAVMIGISAAGGGTVGIAYASNRWSYTVTVDGEPVITGDDLRSGGLGSTHAEMTRSLANFLAAAGESLSLFDDRSEYAGEYTPAQQEFLAAEYERFGMFATDGE
jgi:hypothetical protein